MGLDVELFRAGSHLAVVQDGHFRFADAIERAQERREAPMLDRIDLYGALELSWDEMPELLGELNRMLVACTDDRERAVLEAVHRLAVRCGADTSLGLRFVGD